MIICGPWSRLVLLLLCASAPFSTASDWPCYRKDARRSAATDEKLAFPLSPRWIHTSAAPRPAWPEPGRAINPLDFDRAAEPVSANGLVYIASSVDDTLYALHANDGSVAWRYTADAPLRFAPHIDNGRCYLAGDDGQVVCLDAQSGKALWNYRPMPYRMLVGNGRMISRWPCRSGVLVQDGVVYGTAGMWPAEGTCCFALDAKTGKPLWCNDTTDAMYVAYPHDGLSHGGPTPQGYAVLDGRVLIIPTGMSGPAGFDAKTGHLLFWSAKGPGSTWACAGDGVLLTTGVGWQGDQEIRLGEAPLWEADGLAFFSLPDGKYAADKKWNAYRGFPGSARKGKERLRGQIDPIGGRDRAVWAGDTLYLSGMGKVEAVEVTQASIRQRWCMDHPRVYALVLAGDALLAGGDRTVTALRAADGQVIWKTEVDGQARGLALADGQVFVSTSRGTLYAFAGGVAATQPKPPNTSPSAETPPLPPGLTIAADEQGFALVVGGEDTSVAEALAARTRLNVIALLANPAKVAAARTRLLGGSYGTGVVVHSLPADGRLPYADYFANRVVVNGSTGGLEPTELYRVLHPCTGQMSLLNMDAASVNSLADKTGCAKDERKGTSSGSMTIQRGSLAGAFDWNTKNELDERVRWPLELLWFGGPGRDRMLNRHNSGYPPPIPAHGRVFIEGQSHVIAVDAYNGTELWSLYVPGFRHIAADDRFAYIGARGGLLACDASTGRPVKIAGRPSMAVFSLDKPLTFDAKKGNKYSGSLRITRTPDALELTLDTTTPTPNDRDAWIFRFDFREPSERLGRPDRGCFPLLVTPHTATLRQYDWGPDCMPPEVLVSRSTDDEQRLTVRIGLDEIHRLTGKPVTGFDLSAEVQLFQGERRWLNEMPLTHGRDPLGNGTATFVLTGAAEPALSPWASVEQVQANALPSYASDWGRTPFHKRHDGNIPMPPLAAEKQLSLRERLSAITAVSQERRYLRTYGCSGTISSASMDFFRSGTVGLYDLNDDSGMRNFPGIKPGCRITLLPAQGILFSAEGNADCFCPYSFATSLAMNPTAHRRNEDWALYYGPEKASTVRKLALNFGAPGDRRAPDGTLWLGYPRQPMGFATGGAFGPEPHTLDLPVTVETFPGTRTVRVNADRVPIANTETPWVSASGQLGIRALHIGLTYHDPRTEVLSYPVDARPQIDGRLDDACWSGDPGTATGEKEAGWVRIRHDAERLYMAHTQTDRPTKRNEETFRVLLGDPHDPLAAQFGLRSNGDPEGQLVSCEVGVPPIKDIAVDGKADDWKGQGLALGLPEERGTLHLGWSADALLALAVLPRSFFSSDPAWTSLRIHLSGLESSDELEAVIDVPGQNVATLSASLNPAGQGKTRDLEPFRDTKPVELLTAHDASADQIVVEMLFPAVRLGIRPELGARLALKLVAFNPKSTDANIATGGASRRAIAQTHDVLVLSLSDKPKPEQRLKASGVSREWYGAVVRHAPPPVSLPAETWQAAASSEKAHTQTELAIPFRLLRELGLKPEQLVVSFEAPDRMETDWASLASAFRESRRIVLRPEETTRNTCTVRMHFAEIAGAKAGERTFSVRVQGQTASEVMDVARETGGTNAALVKTFKGIAGGRILDIEFIPGSSAGSEKSLPMLNGIEVISESP